ncbi:hypothetical protein Y032_0303g1902 [Ancylostoma ceylanicum]|uniref:Uncharacterized protein n=1 Tax=Ancylostoma ceylanicum TaxID=53326 RepID=A0A016S400_9BILA|nr:hypothetical protein Y032_0303g1902 [Ancylostoma ceylanicum]
MTFRVTHGSVAAAANAAAACAIVIVDQKEGTSQDLLNISNYFCSADLTETNIDTMILVTDNLRHIVQSKSSANCRGKKLRWSSSLIEATTTAKVCFCDELHSKCFSAARQE